MLQTTMKEYRENVEKNTNFFETLQEKMTQTAKKITKLNKEHNDGERTSAEETVGGFNFSSWLQDMVQYGEKQGVPKEITAMFVYFDGTLTNKYDQYSFSRAMKSALGLSNDRNTYFQAGLYITRFRGNSGFSEEISEQPSYYNKYYTPMEIIHDCKKSDSPLMDGYAYLCSYPKIFPKSVQNSLKRLQKKKSERTELSSLENTFQYKMYLKTMPEKFTLAFVKDELRRLTNNMPLRKNGLLTKMFVINAVLETYDFQELMEKETFRGILRNQIMESWESAKDFTESEKKAVLTPNLTKALAYVMYNRMGFSLDTDIEKELTKA